MVSSATSQFDLTMPWLSTQATDPKSAGGKPPSPCHSAPVQAHPAGEWDLQALHKLTTRPPSSAEAEDLGHWQGEAEEKWRTIKRPNPRGEL